MIPTCGYLMLVETGREAPVPLRRGYNPWLGLDGHELMPGRTGHMMRVGRSHMATGKFVAYHWVSAATQGEVALGLQAQRAAG